MKSTIYPGMKPNINQIMLSTFEQNLLRDTSKGVFDIKKKIHKVKIQSNRHELHNSRSNYPITKERNYPNGAIIGLKQSEQNTTKYGGTKQNFNYLQAQELFEHDELFIPTVKIGHT